MFAGSLGSHSGLETCMLGSFDNGRVAQELVCGFVVVEGCSIAFQQELDGKELLGRVQGISLTLCI